MLKASQQTNVTLVHNIRLYALDKERNDYDDMVMLTYLDEVERRIAKVPSPKRH